MGLFRRTRAEPEIDPDARSPQLGLKNKDLAMLGAMMDAGVDLDAPRHVLHRLDFPDEAAARAAAAEATAGGWTCEVVEPGTRRAPWTVNCERFERVVLPPNVVEDGNFFDAVVDAHGGTYRGWEAAAD